MFSKSLRTNVLAIRCLENLVLAGMGSILYIYEKDSYQLKSNLDCLYPNNIHGIVLGPNNKLAVFGAKSICVCSILKEEEIIFKKQTTDQFNDWIIAVEWISVKKQAQLAILFAHNYVCIYNVFDGSSRVVYCKEKCILYGGSISGTSDENLVIFSGTVFQEILIWKINNNPGSNENVPVLHRLTGHKGVIFSVVYCPYSRLVCSTSDDRTVRLWKVTERDTSEGSDVNWQMAEITLMKTMFSHTARVWRAVIKNDVIVTIGEDSLMCTWSLTGELLNKVHAHRGAPIWSIDITENGEKIFTGGADGSVCAWPTMCCRNNPKIISLSSNDKCNVPKYISYLSSGTILIFNDTGTLLCYDKEATVPKASLHLEKYCAYCIMQVSPCRSFVALASREGEVTIYKEIISANTWHLRRLVEERIMESQIFSLQWLRHDTLVACGANGRLRIFNFTMVDAATRVEAQCTLPASRERWLTAAVIYEELLVCGDRAGNVHAFEMSDMSEDAKPVQTFSKVHGKIGVQSFAVVDGKLMTTGRDAMLRFYELSSGDRRRLLMLHRKKMPMDWIGGALTANGTVLVLGFKEVEFMMYDLLHEKILIRVPCGGGHRSWDCTLLDGTASFAYVRNKQVYALDYPLESLKLPILQTGFHTKETCCLRRVLRLDAQDVFVSGSEDCSLRISCASATSRDDPFAFCNLGIFDGHLSGVKCISTVRLRNDASDKTNNRYLVFSAGGRAQLKVWEMKFKYNQRMSPNVDVSCSDVKSHMLHGQDQYRRKPWQETKQFYVVEPETRYMDICAYYPAEDPKHVLIFVACADGYLRLLVYDIQTSNIYLKVSARYVNRCILKVHVLPHEHKIIVLTMTTDGVLRFFDFTETVSKIYEDAHSENQDNVDFSNAPFAEFSLHQSGINSFDLKSADEDKYLLITGGDDNLLNLVCFQLCVSQNDKLLSLMLSKWNTASAHSAQITGLKFKSGDQICSVGIDQRVIIYSYLWHDGVLSANILNQVFTSVTDAQGMDLWSSDDGSDIVCIYGRGFEVLSI
ncbi:WD repeat-containing protein 6 [Ooceraea biroi]|uniref:WD repeat-containing protein 6 n=1 Tax=Ooceraea biroi TaxID=2015173 RepID=UPI000F089135|nr:WD repeat-containing protein 6 [Ooceraea biroi]